jgi:hypothetical protein
MTKPLLAKLSIAVLGLYAGLAFSGTVYAAEAKAVSPSTPSAEPNEASVIETTDGELVGGLLGGAAAGAAVGAVGGAIAGNAGKGAAIGAGVGGLLGIL